MTAMKRRQRERQAAQGSPAGRGRVPNGVDSLGRAVWVTPLATRLMSKMVELPNGCWEWSGTTNNGGYGTLGRSYAHRLSYEIHVGPVPAELVLDHLCHSRDPACPGGPTCRHRRCINPTHLEPVTSAENTRRGSWANRTHCPQGHPYDEENTKVGARGRYCRACNREYMRRRRQAEREER